MIPRSMAIAAIALVNCTWAAAQSASFDAASGFRYNSNLSNAQDSADVRDDFFWKFAAGLAWNKPAGRDWRFAARIFAGTEVPFQYSAFTMAKTGVDLRATRKFGLGAAAPSASAAVSFERDFFQDPQMSMWLLVPSVKFRGGLVDRGDLPPRCTLRGVRTFQRVGQRGRPLDPMGAGGALVVFGGLPLALR